MPTKKNTTPKPEKASSGKKPAKKSAKKPVVITAKNQKMLPSRNNYTPKEIEVNTSKLAKKKEFRALLDDMIAGIDIDVDDLDDDQLAAWEDFQDEIKPTLARKNWALWTAIFSPVILPGIVKGMRSEPTVPQPKVIIKGRQQEVIPPTEPRKIVNFAKKYFEERGLELCKSLTETDLARLKEDLKNNWGKGEEAFSEKFKESYPVSKSRLETIYRSERHISEYAGVMERAKDAGHSYKRWETVGDERTCDACLAMDGEIVSIDEKFSNGQMFPSAHPNCYSEDTEVFTENGWKLFKDVNPTEKIWTLNLTSKNIELDEQVNQISYRYSGDMIHFKNKTLDCLVTPEHQMVVNKSWDFANHPNRPFRLIPASNVATGDRIPRSGKWIGISPEYITIGERKFLSTDFMSFMGWYISEGSICKYSENLWQISISQQKEVYRSEIIELCQRMFPKIWIGSEAIWIPNPNDEFSEYLLRLGHSHEKYIPSELLQLNPELLKIFLLSFVKGDGSISQCNWNGHPEWNFRDVWSASTSSPKLMNNLTEIALKIGIRPNFRIQMPKPIQHHNGLYTSKYPQLCVDFGNLIFTSYDKKFSHHENYDGMVYCLEMKNNHSLYVRRNGKANWSGNCRCSATTYSDEDYEELPDEFIRQDASYLNDVASFIKQNSKCKKGTYDDTNACGHEKEFGKKLNSLLEDVANFMKLNYKCEFNGSDWKCPETVPTDTSKEIKIENPFEMEHKLSQYINIDEIQKPYNEAAQKLFDKYGSGPDSDWSPEEIKQYEDDYAKIAHLNKMHEDAIKEFNYNAPQINHPTRDREKKLALELKETLDAVTTKQDLVMWRGEYKKDWEELAKAGSGLTDRFTSVSQSKSIAEQFKSGHTPYLVRIEMPSGTHAIPSWTENVESPNEKEWILNKDTKLEVTSKSGNVLNVRVVLDKEKQNEQYLSDVVDQLKLNYKCRKEDSPDGSNKCKLPDESDNTEQKLFDNIKPDKYGSISGSVSKIKEYYINKSLSWKPSNNYVANLKNSDKAIANNPENLEILSKYIHSSKFINESLRDKKSTENLEYKNKLNNLIDQSPLQQDVILYRGISPEALDKYFPKDKNTTYTETGGFASFSGSEEIAKAYSTALSRDMLNGKELFPGKNPVIIELHAKQGTPGLFVENYEKKQKFDDNIPPLHEVILKTDQKYKLLDVKKEKYYTRYVVESITSMRRNERYLEEVTEFLKLNKKCKAGTFDDSNKCGPEKESTSTGSTFQEVSSTFNPELGGFHTTDYKTANSKPLRVISQDKADNPKLLEAIKDLDVTALPSQFMVMKMKAGTPAKYYTKTDSIGVDKNLSSSEMTTEIKKVLDSMKTNSKYLEEVSDFLQNRNSSYLQEATNYLILQDAAETATSMSLNHQGKCPRGTVDDSILLNEAFDFIKLNYNCPDSEKIGSGPGSCSNGLKTIDELEPEELDAISDYTRGLSNQISSLILDGKLNDYEEPTNADPDDSPERAISKLIDTLDETIDHSAYLKPGIYYHGTDDGSKYVEGEELEYKTFMSVTNDPETAKEFGYHDSYSNSDPDAEIYSSHILKINIPEGMKGIEVSPEYSGSDFPDMEESILPRDIKLKVGKSYIEGNTKITEVDVIPSNKDVKE